jgi:hypothetical protein
MVVTAVSLAFGVAAVGVSVGDSEEDDPVMTIEQEQAAIAHLPSLETARLTNAVYLPQFLGEEEVLALHVAIEKIQTDGAGRLCRDAEGMPQIGSAPWETTYLHTAGGFPRECEQLRERMLELAHNVDEEQGWGLLGSRSASDTSTMGPLNFRTVEYHEVRSGGALPNPDHFDGGSLVTVDILLTEQSENFSGGGFATSEADGQMQTYPEFCHKGDALVFVSHKRHSVRPVTSGRRAVLVAELWRGAACECAHRCTFRDGSCCYSPALAAASLLVSGVAEPENIASAY